MMNGSMTVFSVSFVEGGFWPLLRFLLLLFLYPSLFFQSSIWFFLLLIYAASVSAIQLSKLGERTVVAGSIAITDSVVACLFTFFLSSPLTSPVIPILFLFPALGASVLDLKFGAILGILNLALLFILETVREHSLWPPGPYLIEITGILLLGLFLGTLLSYSKRQGRQSQMLISLIESGQQLGSSLSLERVVEALGQVLGAIFSFNTAAVYLIDERSRDGMVKLKGLFTPFRKPLSDFVLATEGSQFASCVREKIGFVVSDLRKESDSVVNYPRFRSALMVPLQFEGRPLGGVLLTHPLPHAYDEDHLRTLSIIANQSSVAFRNVQLHETTRVLAITDSLTKVFTHSFFQEALLDQIGQCAQKGKPLSLIMLDVDYFKRINDTFGHPQGDRVLAQLAAVLKEHASQKDLLSRYGGDEFCVLLPEASKMEAAVIAERVRSGVEEFSFIAGSQPVKITLSCGIASFPDDANSGGKLLEAADKALYQAKQGGRNRVAIFS